jgi:4-diphosphocytidyl-2-C-methyl-D-erythritol kinase
MGSIVFPNAKINIGLHITGKRPDGYHNLETVFYPVQWHDFLELEFAIKTELVNYGHRIDGNPDNNLVLKAYHLLAGEYEMPAIRFHLLKAIPTGAGLGGGSADAAFTLRALNEVYDLKLNTGQLENYATQLGSDCTFFIKNKPVFATGRGNVFENVELNLSNYHILIVYPGIHVSTADAYRKVIIKKPVESLKTMLHLPVNEWKDKIINAFEKSVFEMYPEIAVLKNGMYNAGAMYASMSGSGSAVYGIFRHLPEQAVINTLLKQGYRHFKGSLKPDVA